MPAFSYVAVDGQGKDQKGLIEADSARQAADSEDLSYQSDLLAVRSMVAASLAKSPEATEQLEGALTALRRLYGNDDETLLFPGDLVPDSLSTEVDEHAVQGLQGLLRNAATVTPDALERAATMFSTLLKSK